MFLVTIFPNNELGEESSTASTRVRRAVARAAGCVEQSQENSLQALRQPRILLTPSNYNNKTKQVY